MQECRNFFVHSSEDGTYTIEDGKINAKGDYIVGQYIRIMGSMLNDGVYLIEQTGIGYIDVSIHDEDYPLWFPPTGGHDAWPMGARVTHLNVRYVSLIPANTTVPGTGNYWDVVGYTEHALRNETFTGHIVGLRVPQDFVRLAHVIENYEQKKGIPNALTHESFGGYSYQLATDANGMPATWQKVFVQELNRYRRMFEEAII